MPTIDSKKLREQVKAKYTIVNNSFRQVAKPDSKDLITVEVGDVKQPDFYPQVKINRWGTSEETNEVNFSIRLKEDDYSGSLVETEGEIIKWIKGNKEVHLYDKPDASEDGGYELEVVFNEKPASNVVEFTIQTKELDFFYQPALTQEEIDEGASRPENVVGSYAVYHKTKGGMNRDGGMEYKTGKAFHIYRPKVTDKKGEETWAELNIDEANGVLSVTVPQEFLDKAVYPVIVDPTFGYTSVGGSIFDATALGAITKTLNENGTLTSISGAVAGSSAGNRTVLFALYDSSYNLIEGLSGLSFNHTSYSFETKNSVISPSLTSGTLYFGLDSPDASNTTRIAVDTTGGVYDTLHRSSASADSSWPDPYIPTTNFTNRLYSIYATYTPTTNSYPSVVGSITTGTSSAVSHTVSSGTDVLVVSIGTHQGAISNVQWSGNALTLAVDADTAYNENAEIWYLNTPTAGTGNITYTSNGSHTGWAAINVQDCAPVSSPTTAEEAGSDGDLSITAPAYQCLVIDAIYSEADVTKDTADATQAADIQGNSYENFGSMHVPVGPGQVKIMGWNLASSQRTAHVALALQAILTTNVSVDADVVTLTGSLPAPTVTGKANVAADVVTTTLSVQAPTITGKANVTADVVTLTGSIPSPTITGDANLTADVVTTTTSLPAPTVTGIQNASTSADVVTLTGSIPAPTVTAIQNVSTTADVATSTLSAQAPTITGKANVIVDVITLNGSLLDPTITTDSAVNVSVDADVVLANLSVQTPTITGKANVTADVVTTTTSLPAPSVSTTWFVSVVPDAMVLASSLPEPTVTDIQNVSTTADVITLTGSIPAATITGDANITADVITLTGSIPAATISAIMHASVSADVVTTSLSIPEPTLAVEGGYSGNASWGIDINTFGLVMNKKARIPTWTTSTRPTGKKGLFGFNRETNAIEVYNTTTDEWAEFNANP